MARWVISDTHFYHEMIKGKNGFCSTRKQFETVEEMNETIVNNWNAVVDGEDTVYHLGDIGFGKRKETVELLKRLHGRIFFVKANHDNSRDFKLYERESPILMGEPKFQFIPMGTIIKRKGVQYLLTHYPQGLGEQRKNMRNLCGHIHENAARDANVLNVGIDSPEIKELNGLFGAPILLDDAMDLVDKKHQPFLDAYKGRMK